MSSYYMEDEVWSGGNLKKIDQSDIHKICSDQVIVDLVSAVKEIVENSVDAKSTSIKILLEQGGFNSIQITDNGSGIDVSDYQVIALKHFTSKISNFEELQKGITSLGFRGEAISSLCSLSKKFTICTKTEKDKTGVCISYDKNGTLIDVTPISHPVCI